MPTLIFCTGFEGGAVSTAVSASLVAPQTGLAFSSSLTGSSGISAVASRGAHSAYGLRLIGSDFVNYSNHATAASYTYGVLRFYFKVAVLPSGTVTCFGASTTSDGWFFKVTSTGRLLSPGNDADCGINVGDGQWHRIDMKVFGGANAKRVDWLIDGGFADFRTSAVGGTNDPFTGISTSAGGSAIEIHYDDLAVSATSADYPLGPGYVRGIRPSSLTVAAAGVFVRDATANAIDTTDWARLDDDLGGTTDFIRQTTGSATGSVAIGFNNTDTNAINGVQAIAQYHAAATGANTVRIWGVANSISTYLHGSAAAQPTVGVATPVYSTIQLANGAVPWTDAMLDGTVLRFGTGGGTDVNPVPRWDAFLLEVDYLQVITSAPPQVFHPAQRRRPWQALRAR